MPNSDFIDEDIQKENEAHQKLRDAEIKELKRCYRAVFNSDDGDLNIAGAAVLYDLAILCRINNTSFSSDALQMARNEGRREVYLWIQAALGE
jgi:hypothetical protein